MTVHSTPYPPCPEEAPQKLKLGTLELSLQQPGALDPGPLGRFATASPHVNTTFSDGRLLQGFGDRGMPKAEGPRAPIAVLASGTTVFRAPIEHGHGLQREVLVLRLVAGRTVEVRKMPGLLT